MRETKCACVCLLRLQPTAQGVGRWAGPGPMCPGWGGRREPWKVAVDRRCHSWKPLETATTIGQGGQNWGSRLPSITPDARQSSFLTAASHLLLGLVSSKTRQTAVGLLRGRSWVISRPRCVKYSWDTSALKMCGCPHSLFPGFPCRMQQLGSTLKRCLYGCPAAVLFDVPISPLPKQTLED